MDILEVMQSNLTQDDIRQLKDIYAPTQVAVPDACPFNGLCVTRDGTIRFYGLYRTTFDVPDHVAVAPTCYIESKDCGLSWKRHILSEDLLGKSTYVPFLDKYLALKCNGDIGDKGFWACLGDNPDSAEYEKTYVKANLGDPIDKPFVMKSRNRILTWHGERRENPYNLPGLYPVVHYSDDGKTWHTVRLGEAPYFEKKWPHKGYRWQQNNRELTIVEKEDGTLQCISRTSMDVFYTATSKDGGETWSEFTPTTFNGTATFPCMKKFSDGRILFAFCNTRPLPELKGADGVWEDVFTNRDASHLAISEDDGKTWKGFRELRLNPLRHNADFRTIGENCTFDKSVHQFEIMELPFNKALIVSGQHKVCRNIMIVDLDWLYETKREENFLNGFTGLSTQGYVKSIVGGWKGKGTVGHCAYNRFPSALLMPSPENNGKEALHLAPFDDNRMMNGYSGAVWNFPASRKGIVTLRAHLPGKGLRVSLLDYWMNPTDDTVAYFAPFSIVLRGDMQNEELFTDFEISFDCDKKQVRIQAGEYLDLNYPLNGELPNGLYYLHLQSAVAENDEEGSYVANLKFKSLDK